MQRVVFGVNGQQLSARSPRCSRHQLTGHHRVSYFKATRFLLRGRAAGHKRPAPTWRSNESPEGGWRLLSNPVANYDQRKSYFLDRCRAIIAAFPSHGPSQQFWQSDLPRRTLCHARQHAKRSEPTINNTQWFVPMSPFSKYRYSFGPIIALLPGAVFITNFRLRKVSLTPRLTEYIRRGGSPPGPPALIPRRHGLTVLRSPMTLMLILAFPSLFFTLTFPSQSCQILISPMSCFILRSHAKLLGCFRASLWQLNKVRCQRSPTNIATIKPVRPRDTRR